MPTWKARPITSQRWALIILGLLGGLAVIATIAVSTLVKDRATLNLIARSAGDVAPYLIGTFAACLFLAAMFSLFRGAHEVAVEGGALTVGRGRRRRTLSLSGGRFALGKLEVAQAGTVGSVLVLTLDDGQISFGSDRAVRPGDYTLPPTSRYDYHLDGPDFDAFTAAVRQTCAPERAAAADDRQAAVDLLANNVRGALAILRMVLGTFGALLLSGLMAFALESVAKVLGSWVHGLTVVTWLAIMAWVLAPYVRSRRWVKVAGLGKVARLDVARGQLRLIGRDGSVVLAAPVVSLALTWGTYDELRKGSDVTWQVVDIGLPGGRNLVLGSPAAPPGDAARGRRFFAAPAVIVGTAEWPLLSAALRLATATEKPDATLADNATAQSHPVPPPARPVAAAPSSTRRWLVVGGGLASTVVVLGVIWSSDFSPDRPGNAPAPSVPSTPSPPSPPAAAPRPAPAAPSPRPVQSRPAVRPVLPAARHVQPAPRAAQLPAPPSATRPAATGPARASAPAAVQPRPAAPAALVPALGRLHIQSFQAASPALQSQVLPRRAALETCYGTTLRRRPGLGGTLRMRLGLDVTGHVTGVAVDQDTVHDPAMNDCLRRTVARWRLTPGPAPVTFAFHLRLVPQPPAPSGRAPTSR